MRNTDLDRFLAWAAARRTLADRKHL